METYRLMRHHIMIGHSGLMFGYSYEEALYKPEPVRVITKKTRPLVQQRHQQNLSSRRSGW